MALSIKLVNMEHTSICNLSGIVVINRHVMSIPVSFAS